MKNKELKPLIISYNWELNEWMSVILQIWDKIYSRQTPPKPPLGPEGLQQL